MERYAIAKASFERKDPQAGPQFDSVLTLLDDPDVQATPGPERSAHGRDGVSRSDQSDGCGTNAGADGGAAARHGRRDVAGGPDPRPSDSQRIYTSADPDVAPPIAQTQRIPPWIPAARTIAAQDFHGTLELLIDETGAVTASTMRTSAHPAYNQLLLRATRDWKFTPARHQGCR
jgi:hypothetical protein